VKNPFRSEADAFRFVWVTIGYFALIVIASLISVWLGVIVFVVLTAVVIWWVFWSAEEEKPVRQTPAASPPDEHRILVVANETVGGPELRSEIQELAGEHTRVLVVCPALNSPLRHWASDEDDARAAAQQRLDRSLESMRTAGLDAEGQIGDGDPLQAIEDAIRTFQPDELIISTHPAGRSHWLERGVVDRARERFDISLVHVVVDLDADRTDR
jgi:Ca2+/Na+ antiporter